MEDPTTRRFRPRDYLETLEQRIAYLEGVLRQYRPDIADDHFLQGDLVTGSASAVTRENEEPPLPGSDEHDEIDELAAKAGLLSLNAAGAEPHYLGSSSTFAFSRLIHSSLRQEVLKSPNNARVLSQNGTDPSMLPTPCLLPEYSIAIKLSNVYFQHSHPQYPFLHEPTVRAWEAAIVGGMEGFETLAYDPVPLFFLNMVCLQDARSDAHERRSDKLDRYMLSAPYCFLIADIRQR